SRPPGSAGPRRSPAPGPLREPSPPGGHGWPPPAPRRRTVRAPSRWTRSRRPAACGHAPARRRFRRRRARCPAPAAGSCGTAEPPPAAAADRPDWLDLAAHHQRVRARRLVVAAPQADAGESVTPVEALGAIVVHPDLEEHLRAAAAAGLRQQAFKQRAADSLTPPVPPHPPGPHIPLAATARQHPPPTRHHPPPPRHQVAPHT